MGGETGQKGQLYTGWRTLNDKVYYFQKGMATETSESLLQAGVR